MAYITNDGSRLIDRARTEGKSIVFGSVRMNTIYKSDPYSLVQQTDEWFGESHGSVVGCISHVSVDEVSQVCDSKLAVQCNDNSESWKSLGIYARLDGEIDELLFACESIENGEYKDVTIVELPVTLDGVVADFGLSEGGSGSGGGGEVPANMMTTDTEQVGLSGKKQWSLDSYDGVGSLEEPHEGDRRTSWGLSIANTQCPIGMNYTEYTYTTKEGWRKDADSNLQFKPSVLQYNESQASWSSIVNAARVEQGFDRVEVRQGGDGSIEIGGVKVVPNSDVPIGEYGLLVINNESQIAEICGNGAILDMSVLVIKDGNTHRVSGIAYNDVGLSFDAPITPADGQEICIHWTRFL